MPRKTTNRERKDVPIRHSERSEESLCGNQVAAPAPEGNPEASHPAVAPQVPAQSLAEAPRTSDGRGLADAVFERVNPVQVACDLLDDKDAKSASVKVRVWEKLLEYKFGRPAQMPDEPGSGGAPVPVQIISHIPRPARESSGFSDPSSVTRPLSS